MNLKERDVKYCGVNLEKISLEKPLLNLENFEILKYWIKERYKIYLKKEIYNENFPWTSDLIFQNYRFCNVFRELDKESKWLVKNVCLNNNLNYENKLLNCILFRLINKSETIKIFGPLDFFNLDFILVDKKLKEFDLENSDYVYFSSAFFTSGPKVVSNKFFGKSGNMIIKIIKLVQKYFFEGILNKIKEAKNQKEVYLNLKSFEGLGEFLAYQIFVDFTYIKEFPFSENEFVVAGPGCKKGLNLIFNNFSKLNNEELIFWLRDNQKELFGENFFEIFEDRFQEDKKLNVMCLENCMCEISKYIRALKNEGHPRVKYKFRN